jgi:hypothetical protein
MADGCAERQSYQEHTSLQNAYEARREGARVKKPFAWRPGAPLTPIPGREPKRGRRPPRKAARAVVGVDPAASLGTYTVIGSITFVRPTIPDRVDTRATASAFADARAAFEGMAKEINRVMRDIMFTVTFRSRPTEDEFEALNAEIARRGPTFEVDRAGRCMVCGTFGCSWWAAFCDWRAGQGERPNWRDGAIDTTCERVGPEQLLLEAKERA